MGKSSTENVNAIVRTVINISINILVLAVMLMLIYTYAGKGYEFGKAIFTEKGMTGEENAKEVIVTIPNNSSSGDIADIITKAGLVKDKNVFLVQLMLSEDKDKIEAGTYTLSTADTPSDIIQKLAKTELKEEETQ